MRKYTFLITSVIFFIFCLVPDNSFAQGRSGRGPYGKLYDPQAVETISGEVTRVEQSGCGKNIVLKTESGEVLVHLGPNFFLDHQDVQIKTQDKITVTGSKVMIDGQTYFVAAEVKKGDKRLILRNAKGDPVWSGWRWNN